MPDRGATRGPDSFREPPCQTPSGFRGPFAFLSNFHPCTVRFDELVYKCSEGAYMAQKTLVPSLREPFQAFDGPTAKREGALLVLRSDWESRKVDVMRAVVRAKFIQNHALAEMLLATRDGLLVEVNTWDDRFWGVCQGQGENWLGRILMEVRGELRMVNPTSEGADAPGTRTGGGLGPYWTGP